jgi:Na+-driven multidrug efflux pump
MVLVVLAGATYAIGQILGAETRARAAVWATAMLTGAVIGIVIYIIMPPLLKILLPTNAGGTAICD